MKITRMPPEISSAFKAWQSTLSQIKQTAPALAVALQRARLIPSATPEWKLVFKDAFSLEQARNRQGPIMTKLSEAAGRQINLCFELGVKKPVGDDDIPIEEDEPSIPEWMIPVGVVYEVTKTKWNLQKRGVQWYSTQGLIPKPKRIGRDAYYDKRTIYDYFELIDVLSRKWDLSLTRIRKIIGHVEKLGKVSTPEGKRPALAALLAFLGDYEEYHDQVYQRYGYEDERDGELRIGQESWHRLSGVKDAIKGYLEGGQDHLKRLLSKRALDIEDEILPTQRNDLDEVPF